MQSSALEALLHGMCFLFSDQVKRTTVYKKKRFQRKRNKALDFSLFELIKIADELVWFPPKKITWGKRTTLAGFVHEIRKLRNYVHPGKWAPEAPETMKFTKRVYLVVREVYEVAHSWLYHQIIQDLSKRLGRADAP
jgi:hypothetical protein